MANNNYSENQKEKIVKKIDELRAKGASISKATKAAGIWGETYRAWKRGSWKKGSIIRVQKPRAHRKRESIGNGNQAPTSSTLIAFIGKPKEITDLVKNLFV